MERLLAEKLRAGDIVILNPDNGPCSWSGVEADNIRSAIAYTKTKAAQPIGYVHLTYGMRNIEDVINDIIAWGKLGIRDIFYDECADFWDAAVLRRLTNLLYSQSIPSPIRTVFNMGADPVNLGAAPHRSLVVAYEGAGVPSIHGVRPAWQAALAHSTDQKFGSDWAWSYATKDTPPNPWDWFPS